MHVEAELRGRGLRPEATESSAPQDGWWICERYCVPSRGSGSSAGCSQEALLARCQACRWRAAARLRAHPRTTGESRTCRSRPVAAGSLRGAAAPREVVISAAVRRPFSLSPESTPTGGKDVNTANEHTSHESFSAVRRLTLRSQQPSTSAHEVRMPMPRAATFVRRASMALGPALSRCELA